MSANQTLEQLINLLRTRRCGRCRKCYSDINKVAPCEECWPIRRLLGIVEPEP